MPAPVNVQNGLQPPAVVHLFGHLKNDHMMLRRLIGVRVSEFYRSGHDSFESFFQMLTDNALSIYDHQKVREFTSTRHTHNLCIKTGKTSDNPSRIVLVAASNGSEAGNFPLDGIEDAWIF